MKRIFFLLALTCVLLPLRAQNDSTVQRPIDKAVADSAYVHEDYARAVSIYKAIVSQQGESAQLYFNIGNAYYRMDSIARAVLYYERARLLDPSDDDIRFNLDMARSKTVDKVAPASEMFFVTAFRSLVLSMSISEWAVLAVAAFLLVLLGAAAWLFAPQLRAKQAGFTLAVVALLVCVFSHVAVSQQRRHINHRTSAVIMAPSVVVKSTPSASGTDLFILHEGTHVDITDDTMREWMEVRMSDGKQGWLQRADVEII